MDIYIVILLTMATKKICKGAYSGNRLIARRPTLNSPSNFSLQGYAMEAVPASHLLSFNMSVWEGVRCITGPVCLLGTCA